MATITIQPMEPIGTTHGGPPYNIKLPEAASQTFLKGAIVALDNGGYVAEAAAALAGAGSSLDNVRILGVANEPGHNGATAGLYSTNVCVANESNMFIINSDGVTALLDVGRAFGVEKDTTNHWKVDKSAAAGGASAAARVVVVMELDNRDALGDTQGRYRVIFHSNARALTYTS